jgi:hypothetical protein
MKKKVHNLQIKNKQPISALGEFHEMESNANEITLKPNIAV